MARKAKFVATGPSHLTKVLANLKSTPRLGLSGLRSLKLTLAFRNDHFGARHFVKEQLPKIRYANPTLDIQVEKVRKTAQEAWRPEMELHFANGKMRTLDLHEKWSTTIVKELMDVAGGDPWLQWKAEAAASGIPLINGEEHEHKVVKRPTPISMPSLAVFRASKPPPTSQETQPSDSIMSAKVTEGTVGTSIPAPKKTGAAAVLP